MLKVCLIKVERPIDAETFRFLLQFSPPEKQARILRQRVKQNADTMAVGGALARHMIYQAFHTPLDQQVIAYGPHGKPYLRGYLDAHFNISHSGPYVACAVSDKPVGVDVEQIRPVEFCVIQRVCTEEEQKSIFGYMPKSGEFTTVTDRRALTRFFEIWTAKEAEVKRTGAGLATCDRSSPLKGVGAEFASWGSDWVLTLCS